MDIFSSSESDRQTSLFAGNISGYSSRNRCLTLPHRLASFSNTHIHRIYRPIHPTLVLKGLTTFSDSYDDSNYAISWLWLIKEHVNDRDIVLVSLSTARTVTMHFPVGAVNGISRVTN